MDDGERFLSAFSLFSFFPLFFPPLSFLGVSECSCARGEPGRGDGDTEGGQAGGAGFAEATGGRRRTDGQTETDRRTDGRTLLMLATVRLLEDFRAAADPLPPDGCLRGWRR